MLRGLSALKEVVNLGKLKRSERIAALTRYLVGQPGKVFSLTKISEEFGAAKSTLSEDIGLMKDTYQAMALGEINTFPGVSGGVTYFPGKTSKQIDRIVEEFCDVLSQPERILPGGFIYMTDVIFSPRWSAELGEVFATAFRDKHPEYVVTVETKGIPVALMTARAFDIPLVILRRDSRVTEGSSVSINYVSGTGEKIQTMSLPKRALPNGSRVLLIDDFMRGGGTARGMLDLLVEFEAIPVGFGVLVKTAEPQEKLITDMIALTTLEKVDKTNKEIIIKNSFKA